MSGIENSYTLGKKIVLNALEEAFKIKNQEIKFSHSTISPYEIGSNSNCPFCTDMITRMLDMGHKRGYPFDEENHNFKLDYFNIRVTTKINIQEIEHFINGINK